MRLRLVLVCGALLMGTAMWGQDAVKADPKHYKVESENEKVRILRVHYGPHEKSVMHSHPDGTAVYLSDGNMEFHMPDGSTQKAAGKMGQAIYTPATTHMPENTGDKAFDAIVIELKGGAGAKMSKPAAPAKAEKK